MKIKIKIKFVDGTSESVECDSMDSTMHNICCCFNERKDRPGKRLLRIYPLVNVLSIQID
jgi:hypothetical protein